MRKLMNKAHMEMVKVMVKGRGILQGNSGQGALDQVVSILLSIVLGALLLAGLYALFSNIILPLLQERIMDIFDYAG